MITLQERVHKAKPKYPWNLNKIHHVLNVRSNNKNKGMINDNLLSLSYGKIVNKNIDSAEGLLPESFETYQIVQSGDIVMRLTDLQNDKRSIRQGLVKEQGIITSAYDAVYPTKGHDSRYWAYTLLALDLAKYYYSLGGGVRQSIKFKDFPNDWIYTPPTETQKEIADFLDRETARIDTLIEKKERLLKIIQEKKNSLVIYACLGIESGKVATISDNKNVIQELVHGYKTPDNWEIHKVHNVFNLRKNNKNISMIEENLLSLSYGNIVRKDINNNEGLLPESYETYQIVQLGDIVLRLTDLQNDKKSIRQGLVKEKGIITSAYDAVFVGFNHDPRFWAYTLLSLEIDILSGFTIFPCF